MEEIKTQEEHAQTYIGNHRSTLKQEELREWAKDITFLKDKTDYTLHIQNKLPRLHDQVLPSSLQEFAFLGSNLRTFIDDSKVDGIKRCAELERIESSLFYNQLKKNGIEHSFKDLYQKSNYLWGKYGIPYNKRKKLLLVEIEMVSLLMCDVLPSNYSEQGIWVDDESQGKFYTFFKDKNVDTS